MALCARQLRTQLAKPNMRAVLLCRVQTTDCSSPGSERGPARIQGREDLQEDFREDPQEDPQERPRELPSSRPRSLDKSTKCVSDGEVDFVLIFMSILCSGIHTSVSSKYKYSYSIWYLISHYIVTKIHPPKEFSCKIYNKVNYPRCESNFQDEQNEISWQ